jgi:peptide/nickel transport system substrate-binding protein
MSKKDKRNLSRRDFIKIAGGASASVLLAACGTQVTPTPIETSAPLPTAPPTAVPPVAVPPTAAPTATLIPTPTPVAGAPKPGGTVLEARTYETPDLDPKSCLNTESGQIIMPRLYETLVTSGPTLEPVAKLATSWKIVNDKDWEFKIRQGVKWHDGTDFTVEDVKYSYDIIMDPNSGHPAVQYVSDVDSVEIVDKETMLFKMKALNVVFPNQQHWCYIVPQSLEDKPEDWLKNNALGTGPFMLESWQPDVEMILVKNPYYWKPGRPYLDKIVMKVFPEESTSIAGLRTGEVDLCTLEDPNNFQLLVTNPNLNLLLVPANGGIFWCFNGDRAPMDDVKVRQAISSAIDRQEVVNLVGAGLGAPSGAITPAFADVFVPPEEIPNYTYDVERAKQLLSESSVPNGFKMDCLYINTLPIMKNGAQLFQKFMEAIGIEVELRGMETNVWVDTVVNTGDFYFTTNLEIGGPTPEAIFKNFACGSAITGFYGPCFPELDAMVDKAGQTTDAAERKALWRDIQIKAGQLLPTAAFTFARTHVVATQKWVQGFVAFPDKAHRQWEDVWLLDKKT